MKNIILEIRQLFEIQGDSEYYGENLSQYEHAAQAAILAKRQGYDEEVQIAAFLHDIGHLFPAQTEEELMEVYGRKDHESVAADWLRERGFSEKTAILVENHVNAKRYLTFIDEDYFEALSEASKQTLIFQGGRMTEIEAKEFEQNPYFELIIKMRRWDEAAKMEAMKLPTLDHFLNIIDIYLTNK
jgi:phosphonate degradation associated HDIG domain protein